MIAEPALLGTSYFLILQTASTILTPICEVCETMRLLRRERATSGQTNFVISLLQIMSSSSYCYPLEFTVPCRKPSVPHSLRETLKKC